MLQSKSFLTKAQRPRSAQGSCFVQDRPDKQTHRLDLRVQCRCLTIPLLCVVRTGSMQLDDEGRREAFPPGGSKVGSPIQGQMMRNPEIGDPLVHQCFSTVSC